MTDTTLGATPAKGLKTDGCPWPLVRADTIFDLRYGKSLVEAQRRTGTIPVYGTNGQCGWHDTALFQGPGVILGRKGQGPLGVEWCDSDFWVIDTAYCLRLKAPSVHLRYAYYLIKFVGLNHLKDGTSNPTLSRDAFGRQLLPLPPLDVQERLATILTDLDDKIVLNRRMNQTLEAMAQALFRSWFVDFDPIRAKAEGRQPEGMDAETAALFPSKLVDSEVGKIPEGWSLKKVSDVVEGVFDGPDATPPTASHGPIFLGIKNLTGTVIDLSDIRYINESDWPIWTKRVEPRPRDIVFTYEATLGHFALIPPGLRCCLGRRTALIRPKSDCHFLFHWFVGEWFQRFLKSRIHPGATVDRILLTDFPSYPVLAAPQPLVDRFEALAAPIWSKIHANQSQSQVLAALRDTLLPKLLSGEIRVGEAGAQVAASA